jgi:hypothetical protein
MAGRKQHYDPKFLLKGFESKRKGNTVFVWYFLKDSSPREESTGNIGHSPFFYGEPGDGSLDSLITENEKEKYAVVVNRVKLMAPQFVRPYVKTNKNDARDAEAICEAVTRPTMRFVPIKPAGQQAILALHRARQGVVKARPAQANQLRSDRV